MAVGMVVIALSPVIRIALAMDHVIVYSNFFCRLDGLMAGAMIAVLVRSPSFLPSRWVRAAWIALLIGAPLVILADTQKLYWIEFTLVALSAASFVYLALFSEARWLQFILRNRFLTFTGTISYGLYLLHKIPTRPR